MLVSLELFAAGQLDEGANFFFAAQNYDRNFVVRTFAAQHVGKVVEVLNVLPVKLNQDVARQETCFASRAVRTYIGELDPFAVLSKVGDGAKVRTIALALLR